MVTVGPINDFAAAVELVKLVSHSLPHVKFQVWGIPGNLPAERAHRHGRPHAFTLHFLVPPITHWARVTYLRRNSAMKQQKLAGRCGGPDKP